MRHPLLDLADKLQPINRKILAELAVTMRPAAAQALAAAEATWRRSFPWDAPVTAVKERVKKVINRGGGRRKGSTLLNDREFVTARLEAYQRLSRDFDRDTVIALADVLAEMKTPSTTYHRRIKEIQDWHQIDLPWPPSVADLDHF